MSRAETMETATVSEGGFQAQVRDLARLLGWGDYASWLSVYSPAGWPDLVLVRGGRLIFAELKTDRGKVTSPQREWLWALAQTAVEVYVWRPSCWQQIEERLR